MPGKTLDLRGLWVFFVFVGSVASLVGPSTAALKIVGKAKEKRK